MEDESREREELRNYDYKNQWSRLPDRESQSGRTAYWAFRLYRPPEADYDENPSDCLLRDEESLAADIQQAYFRYRADRKKSISEEQLWTVFVPPIDIEDNKIVFRDSALKALSDDIVTKCAGHGDFRTMVSISFACFDVRMIDLVEQRRRRRNHCRAACRALFVLARRLGGKLHCTSYRLVALNLWHRHGLHVSWDDIGEDNADSRADKRARPAEDSSE
jgi:hypothetical protein